MSALHESVDWNKMTLPLLIKYASDRYRDKLMWIHEDNRFFNYDSLSVLSNKLAAGLKKTGFKKGDHIGIMLPNFPEWSFIFFAATGLGGVVVPLSLQYSLEEIKYALWQSDCNYLICPTEFGGVNYIDIFEKILPVTGRNRSLSGNNSLPELKNIIMFGTPKLIAPKWAISFDCLLKDGKEDQPFPDYGIDPDDLAVIQYKPGSATFLKGVMLSHNQIVRDAYYVGKSLRLKPGDRYMDTCPFYDSSGLIGGILASAVFGATLIKTNRFEPEKILKLIESHHCNVISGMKSTYIMLLKHPNFSKYNVSSLKKGWSTGKAVIKKIHGVMKVEGIVGLYGTSESSWCACMGSMDDPIDIRVERTGKPFPGVGVTIRDPVTGKDLSPGMVGEICLSGWNVSRGYYKMTQETAMAFDHEGRYNTGDLGRLTEDGYLVWEGKVKESIKAGGRSMAAAQTAKKK